jgi:hypothetical protein
VIFFTLFVFVAIPVAANGREREDVKWLLIQKEEKYRSFVRILTELSPSLELSSSKANKRNRHNATEKIFFGNGWKNSLSRRYTR